MTKETPSVPYALDVSIAVNKVHRHRIAFPWSLGRPYMCENWNGAYRLIPQVSGAGLLSGDHINQRVRLGAHAKLRLESAGAMQVLAGNSGPARSDWHFTLDPGAMLVLDAEPYALMPGADLDLRSHFQLAQGAIVLASEAICEAHVGNRQTPSKCAGWRTETRIAEASGVLKLIDRQVAAPSGQARLRRLPDRAAAFGTIWVLADMDAARTALTDLPNVPCIKALTPLRAETGFAIRLVAPDGGALRRTCRLLMNALEQRLAKTQARPQAARTRTALAMVAQT